MHNSIPKTVRMERTNCPLGCAVDDAFVLEGRDRINGLPGAFKIVRCRSCGLMRTNPRPTAATIGFYYPSDYAPYLTDAQQSTRNPTRGLKRLIHKLLELELKRLPATPPGNLLEIGCASGSYLAQMQKEGWKVEGVEFSDSAAQQARKLGLQVQTAAIETAAPPEEPVDIITAWMVLEHLHEPIHALDKMRGWVKPDGWLVASVPDASALPWRLFKSRSYDLHLPAHLYHYTPNTLTRLLKAGGWELKQISWQRNCNNLLWNLQYLAEDRQWRRRLRWIQWLRTAPAAARIRLILGILLGFTRQSGRIEFWAQPLYPGLRQQ